ncbi:hypothetical protein [Acidaminobacter sp.]|uniref:hypothetical protein n=1 Tax=Acidaminobacter sp. TaxID=1872102 RepID=UPI0013803227|nr:hypothetical protein [Acidaminobacter sp.]MDK9710976.1 hypothetical protein [Acidaminobacter sp.]MZQ97497.1 hypothetical protein [Acidaminobacter sp.]
MFKKIKALPDSNIGKASVICSVAFFLLIGAVNSLFDLKSPSWPQSSFNELVAHTFILSAFGMSTAGMILGLVAIIKKKDYSVMVGFAVLLGIFMLIVQD